MEILYLIPARGGSKGIPGKNIKPLNGKPLIGYTIEFARKVALNERNIYLSTDSDEIIRVAAEFGLEAPFVRPASLASDSAGMNDVIVHAINHFEAAENKRVDAVMLLQPTAPFRKTIHHEEVLSLYKDGFDMVVSVLEPPYNPYYTLFEEDENGFLAKSKKANFERRQDIPKVYAYNGSIYLFNAAKVKEQPLHSLKRVVKYVMDDIHSIDIDSNLDWILAEAILRNGLIHENS
ncbi:acylneuraminate cytidylyltransferase family protein [Pontibacter sp. E15-1]|uniref:acylneuraminate cytidylyltransferase family protein n=1 Tax=Pontibacter sp. E15-1 TaxID=2919918 RepID=UPI001F4F1E21|nr:acylneuraminate cytidylyltransferase family protein [Pontibacter sp. E15-1]MCJ8166418.1 acylneuraminate cytidylyltransferase family protein [Pontibacter sp. E15-1]